MGAGPAAAALNADVKAGPVDRARYRRCLHGHSLEIGRLRGINGHETGETRQYSQDQFFHDFTHSRNTRMVQCAMPPQEGLFTC